MHLQRPKMSSGCNWVNHDFVIPCIADSYYSVLILPTLWKFCNGCYSMCNKAKSATLLFFTKFSCQPDSTTFHSSQITFQVLDCSIQLLQSNISDSSTYIYKPQTFGICISSFILVWMSVKKFNLKLKIDLNFKELLNQMSNSIWTFRKNETFYFASKHWEKKTLI